MARDDLPGYVCHTNGRVIACGRARTGRFRATTPAIERFARFLEFDPKTGCVLWTGGTTHGRGHTAPYGSFHFERRRWFAHRWAAKHIHGLDIDGYQVDHCCPHTGGRPNTLCVEHLQAVTLNEHVELERARTWILTQVGVYEPEPLFEPDPDAPDLFEPPAWLVKLQRPVALARAA